MIESVSVVGLGKAGLPLAAVLADAGYRVLGVDSEEETVSLINSRVNPLKGEPGLSELVKKHSGGNLIATCDGPQASRDTLVHVIIVPVLLDGEGKPDFKHLDSALTGVGKGLKKNDLVLLETTVPVGTTSGRVKDALEEASRLKAGEDFHLAFAPERIMTGYSISRIKEYPKVVGGLNEASTSRAAEFYSSFSKKVIKVRDCETAEATKIAEGVFRDVNIAIANELYKVCDHYGVDFWELREAASHSFCNILDAGLGVGGHCIPVYPRFFISELSEQPELVGIMGAAREVNNGMAEYFKDKLVEEFRGSGREIRGSKVAVVGLTYREGVCDPSHSRSKVLVGLLKDAGFEVYGVDSLLSDDVIRESFGAVPDAGSDFTLFDGIILVNDLPEYFKAIKLTGKHAIIVDCSNYLG